MTLTDRRRSKHFFWTLGLALLATGAPGQTAAPLSYKEALNRAKTHSLATRVAGSNAKIAAQNEALAAYADDPSLRAAAAAGATYREPGNRTGTGTAAATDKVTRQQTYDLTLNVPLYDFGRQDALVGQAATDTKIAAVATDAAEEELRFAVARIYLDLLTATRTLAVTDQQWRLAKSKHEVQRRDYQQGLRPESDVVTSDVEVGRTGIAYYSAVDALTQAKLQLADLTGAPLAAATEDLQLAATPLKAHELTRVVDQWGQGNKTAAERRQELAAEALNLELDGLRAKRRPVLDAVLTAQEAGTLSPLRTTASGQLRLTWDIPWSGMSRAEQDVVALKRETLTLEAESTSRSRARQVLLGRESLQSSLRLGVLIDSQLALAERQQKLVEKRYDAGQATALEVATVATSLLSIRLDQIRASHNATAAALNIAEAQGVTDLEALFP